MPRSFWLRSRAFCLVSTLVTGCFDPGDGVPPAPEAIYFPVGLALDPEARHLFVANSNFDLQFNAGVLQSFSLDRLRDLVPTSCEVDADCGSGQRCDDEPSRENSGSPSYFCVARSGEHEGSPCGALGEASAAHQITVPGRCAALDPSRPPDGGSSLVVSSVEIGAFARDLIHRPRPGDAPGGTPGRLFLPVGGDATLHYVDVDAEGDLECGQQNNEGACDAAHRRGDEPEEENTRDLRLPTEPFGIGATEDGRSIVLGHQTQGTATLFVNTWGATGPTLEFATGGMPSRPIGVASLPEPAVVAALRATCSAGGAGAGGTGDCSVSYQPGFLITFRDAAEVRLLRVFGDVTSDPARPFLSQITRSSIAANSIGSDSRGIAVDGRARRAAERECAVSAGLVDAQAPSSEVDACLHAPDCVRDGGTAYLDCVGRAAAIPLGVYVANRTPASLLVGHLAQLDDATRTDTTPVFVDSLPLTPGASRVVLGEIINPQGELEPRVFAVCFDSRFIFVYDPVRDRMETQIDTGRGPHALVVDAAHGLGYVGHFTDSYIGVINLDQRFPQTYATIIQTVGVPTPPRASK